MRKIFLLLMAILLLIASASFAESTEVFKVDHENEAVAVIRARLVARDPDFILALPGSGYSVDTIASFTRSRN